MTSPLIITNAGPLIASTNYWGTPLEAQGLAYLSVNARAFRLLVPRSMEFALADMATAKVITVNRPRNPSRYALEIMFDDLSQSPFCLHLSEGQFDRLVPHEEAGRTDLEFTVWTQPRQDVPHEALRRPARYRSVARLLR